jgi:predicted nucleic acid-binding Zn ribbon protein
LNGLAEEPTKPCVFCGKSIPVVAVFCKECEHYQSSYRQLLSKIDVTGLIALGSTSAILFKFLNLTFFTPPLAIFSYASECSSTNFVVLFSNYGKRPGLVSNVWASRYYKFDNNQPEEEDNKIRLVSKRPSIVDGSTIKFNPITFIPLAENFAPPKSEPGLRPCYRVSYEIAEFGKTSGQSTSVSVPCECY